MFFAWKKMMYKFTKRGEPDGKESGSKGGKEGNKESSEARRKNHEVICASSPLSFL